MKKFVAVLLTIMCIMTLFGCTVKSNEDALNEIKEVEEEIRILRLDEQNLGYPSVYTVSSRGRGYLLMSFIFDTLTWKDENGVVPMIANDWEVSPDYKVWTFNLVDNAKFTDGKALTAEDVVFSYEYMMKHPHQWVNLNMIEEIRAVSDYIVEIKLKEIYAPFITDVAGNVPIMPKHIWENIEEPQKFNTEEAVIGSGPFKLYHYDKDAGSYTFIANEDYFLGKPVVDKLLLNENKQAVLALKSGELDAAQRLSYGEAMELKNEGEFKVIEGPGLWVSRMYFNFDMPEFADTNVRQAIYYAINREEIVEKATRNSGIVGNPGHIHPDSEWYYNDVPDYSYNVEKAKELLEQSGIMNGKQSLKYELLVTNDRVDEAEMIKKYLSDIGIELSVKAIDQKSVDTLIAEGKFQLALNGHGSFGGDPVLLARFVSPDVNMGSTPKVTSQGGKSWSNSTFDKLFLQQLQEVDKETRQNTVSKLQEIIAQELPTLTLYYRKITFAYNEEKLNGWFYTKDGVAIAVPTTQNKLVYIYGSWGTK